MAIISGKPVEDSTEGLTDQLLKIRKTKAKSAPKKEAKSSAGAIEEAPQKAKSGGVDASAVAKAGAQGGSTMDMLGSMGMASGNPYAMAAGAALKVVGNVQKKREARAQLEADLQNRRKERLEDMLSNLGSGVGTLGMA